MANIFPAQARVQPSFAEPDNIVTFAQASGAFALLENGEPRTKIGSEDLWVYINHIDLRTESVASQFGSNFLPSATIAAEFVQTQTYLLRTRAIYDHHEIAAAARYNVGLPSAQELAMRQGIFQQLRSMLLYGYNSGNNEGVLNTQGATAVNLPADTYGNTTASTYDAGQMALFWLKEIANLRQRLYNTGANAKNKIVIVGPQRIFFQFDAADIVQVTSYQRPGSGTSTVGQVVRDVAAESGTVIEYVYDDTLIGQGAGGTDAVIITAPELELPSVPGINTDEFGKIKPSMTAVNVMYNDVGAPIKITTPTPDGAVVDLLELRSSSGWCVRPQGLTIVSIGY